MARLLRPLRFVGAFAAFFGLLYLVIASPLARQTEVTWAVPFGLLPIATLIGVGAVVQELADVGTASRRDTLFGLSAALVSFAVLRLSGAL